MNEVLEYEKARALEGGPSFSLKNRCERAIWGVTWVVLARWTPNSAWRWRAMLLRLFGATIGRHAIIRSSVTVWLPRNLVMGDYAVLGEGVNCYNQALITIGDRAVISQGSHLCAGTHDIDAASFQLVVRPISIGSGAWIAADAFVGPGAVVNDGAVLGARGVAFGVLNAFSIYVGNPAKFVRYRKLKKLADHE